MDGGRSSLNMESFAVDLSDYHSSLAGFGNKLGITANPSMEFQKLSLKFLQNHNLYTLQTEKSA